MDLDKDILLTEWRRCSAEWQPLHSTWSRELRALCLAGLVEVQAASIVETTSSSFPEVVNFIFVQTGFHTEHKRDQYLPSEWFDDAGRHRVKANERLTSIDAMRLTGHGLSLATAIRHGTADQQVDLIDFVQGVADADAECLRLAHARASCDIVSHQIKRPLALKFSVPRSPTEWTWIFQFLGDETTWKTITRRVDRGEIRQAPGGSTKSVAFALDDLPHGYSDDLKAPEKPKRSAK